MRKTKQPTLSQPMRHLIYMSKSVRQSMASAGEIKFTLFRRGDGSFIEDTCAQKDGRAD